MKSPKVIKTLSGVTPKGMDLRKIILHSYIVDGPSNETSLAELSDYRFLDGGLEDASDLTSLFDNTDSKISRFFKLLSYRKEMTLTPVSSHDSRMVLRLDNYDPWPTQDLRRPGITKPVYMYADEFQKHVYRLYGVLIDLPRPGDGNIRILISPDLPEKDLIATVRAYAGTKHKEPYTGPLHQYHDNEISLYVVPPIDPQQEPYYIAIESDRNVDHVHRGIRHSVRYLSLQTYMRAIYAQEGLQGLLSIRRHLPAELDTPLMILTHSIEVCHVPNTLDEVGLYGNPEMRGHIPYLNYMIREKFGLSLEIVKIESGIVVKEITNV